MPNANRIQSVYLGSQNPDSMNAASLYRPGELGAAFEWNDRTYQVVQVDSGATAAASSGIVAQNDVAFWKDRSKYLVTNDLRFSNRNNVAGVFRVAATAGY